ncbi:uncharacterized protein BJ212DRAFT_1300851 [Suillus subaureus]|uniref:Uncharacterized protein n=1 Tax=Suillus subaureus TaxID=48587 RepID=A0A9P7JBW3_9AGAM|nr:uncharacterized protein BJ212DRAFT_1300851 [Suillus subaureus]KAG1813980.1 hypothetical protein BJ212DRAFT_1300851 [Suillus subaureus]
MPCQAKHPKLFQLSPKAKDAMQLQNEYKRCSCVKLKLEQSIAEPPAKCHCVAAPEAGPSDSHVPVSNSPSVMEGPSDDTPNTAGPSNTQNSTAVPGPSDITLGHTPVQAVLSHQFSNISVTTEPPPVTCNVEVMTECSCINPTTSSNNAPAPSTCFTPPRDLPDDSKDLVTNVIGVHMSSFLDTVKWSSGFTTILPCIWKDGKNICQGDTDTVWCLSQLPESDPQSSLHIIHIHHHNWSSRPDKLHNLIVKTLHEGKCMVIRGVEKSQVAKLDVDYLENCGFSWFMHVTIHDVKVCTRDFTYPQVEGMIKEFILNLDDPNKIQFILDLPYTGMGIPEHSQLLNHGIVHGWNQTTAKYPIVNPVHPNNFLINGWALAHHLAILMNFHHDSDREHSLELMNIPIKPNKIKANWNIEVVTLEEGDMFNKKKSLQWSTTAPAITICNVIVKHFWTDIKTTVSVYVKGPDKTQGCQSLTHPGELIDRSELAICLKPFRKLL